MTNKKVITNESTAKRDPDTNLHKLSRIFPLGRQHNSCKFVTIRVKKGLFAAEPGPTILIIGTTRLKAVAKPLNSPWICLLTLNRMKIMVIQIRIISCLPRLLTKVVGYSHWQYIKEEILIPLDLNNTYGSLDDVDADDVMSGYWVGYEPDLKNDPHFGSMIATAEDVGIFLRALNDGSLLNDNEQAIYSSIYEYGHTGLIPGYQSIARYHSDIDTVVVQFVNTAGGTPIVPLFDTGGGTKVMVSNVVYNRIVRILRRGIDIDE
jgi:hypothetical protein